MKLKKSVLAIAVMLCIVMASLPLYMVAADVSGDVFVGRDDFTKGNWGTAYGTEGYLMYTGSGPVKVLPDYVDDITFSEGATSVWSTTTVDVRAFSEDVYGIGKRSISTHYSGERFDVDIALNQQREYTMALYFVDWDASSRAINVDIYDSNDTATKIAPTQVLNDYTGGVYLIYKYDRSVKLKIEKTAGPNPTLSGIFLGEGEAEPKSEQTELIKWDDPRVKLSGNSWYGSGEFTHANTTGDYAELTFNGVAVEYLASLEFNRGKADVYLDGVLQGRYSLYAPGGATARDAVIFSAEGLSDTQHTIKIVTSGEAGAEGGVYVDVSGFRVTSPVKPVVTYLLDDQSGMLDFTPGWSHQPHGEAYKKTFSYSESVGAAVSYSFVGTGVSYIASKETHRGIAEVFIDDVSQGLVDLYNPTTILFQKLFSVDNLPLGEHTIKVVVTGTKNPLAGHTYLDIDAFEITGLLYSLQDIAKSIKIPDAQSGATSIKLPRVPEGYDIAVSETEPANLISADGTIADATFHGNANVTATVSIGEASAEKTVPVFLPGAGHTFGDWSIVLSPTLTDTGLRERTCTGCDFKETEELPCLELSISISSARQTASIGDSAKYDAVWSATVMVGNTVEPSSYQLFNDADTKIKEYGVFYGANGDAVSQWAELATNPELASKLKKTIFDEGEDIDMFSTYGFRLRNCPNTANRAAMFYAIYTYEDGAPITVISLIDEV